MAFGICGRNKDAAYEGVNHESRKAGIIVETFDSLAPAKLALSGFPSTSLASPPLRCAKRRASRRDVLQFPLKTADATREQRLAYYG